MDDEPRFSEYLCEEYLNSALSKDGYYSETSYTQVIVPMFDAYELQDVGFLAVGRSGADGIDFGYRKGKSGIWAFYPIDNEFKYMSPSLSEFVPAWVSGSLSV
ncbi:hypothetical protein [Stutzerimonas stutzeri]|uniref:hypothetical protein n=1 Tax=Stutzerimonas stutzeri TaxID=316 RepID=UPI001C2E3989|nr:hypothetical protein [Stutzerimonas stutzeri]